MACGDLGKADASLQEERRRRLVRADQDRRSRPARAPGLIRQPQAGEALHIHWLEVQPRDLRPAQGMRQRRIGAVQPVGIAERVLNRQMHAGQARLHLDRVVHELDHRVDDALWMHDDLDLLEGQVEEPVRLEDLQPLVHQRRGVEGDLRPHAPGGVVERLLDRDGAHLLQRLRAEWPARRGDEQPPHFLDALAAQALPDRAMLAIHRQDGDAMLLRLGGDDMAGEHERLFVRQRDGLARADRRQRRLEADHAGGRRDDGLHVGMRRRCG